MTIRLADGSELALAQVRTYRRAERGREEQVRSYVTRKPVPLVRTPPGEMPVWGKTPQHAEHAWIPEDKWIEGQRIWMDRGEAAWRRWMAVYHSQWEEEKFERAERAVREAKEKKPVALRGMGRDVDAKEKAVLDQLRGQVKDAKEQKPERSLGSVLNYVLNAKKKHAQQSIKPGTNIRTPSPDAAGGGMHRHPGPGPVEAATTHAPGLQSLEQEVAKGLVGTLDVWQPQQGVEAVTRLVDLKDDGKVIEKSQMDSVEAQAEVLAYFVSEAIGAGVTPTIEASDNEIVHSFAEGKPLVVWMDQPGNYLDKLLLSDKGHLIGLLDYLIANNDRHGGNVVVTPDGIPIPIDHGLAAFDAKRGTDSSFWKRAEQYWTARPAELRQFLTALQAVRPEFIARGRGEWFSEVKVALLNLIQVAEGTSR